MHNNLFIQLQTNKNSHAQKYTKTDKNININYNEILTKNIIDTIYLMILVIMCSIYFCKSYLQTEIILILAFTKK